MITTIRMAVFAVTILATFSPSIVVAFDDGFQRPSLRELSRALGIGTGPGYHNQPCCPKRAVEYNRMLEGCSNPGWVAWKRSQLAPKVPHGPVVSHWAGEDGTPACNHCGHAGMWQAPRHDFEPSYAGDEIQTMDESPTPAEDKDETNDRSNDGSNLYGPNTKSDIDSPKGKKSKVESLPESTRSELNDEDRRSIEELLEGIGAEAKRAKKHNRATYNDAIPGQELWQRLSPETRDLFRREFPNEQLPSGEQKRTAPNGRDTDSSSRNSGSNQRWW